MRRVIRKNEWENLSVYGQARLRTTSQALRASSPSRGASGEEMRLYGMPRPPLDRGGGTALAVTERLTPYKPQEDFI